jgi:hypothetical protein
VHLNGWDADCEVGHQHSIEHALCSAVQPSVDEQIALRRKAIARRPKHADQTVHNNGNACRLQIFIMTYLFAVDFNTAICMQLTAMAA